MIETKSAAAASGPGGVFILQTENTSRPRSYWWSRPRCIPVRCSFRLGRAVFYFRATDFRSRKKKVAKVQARHSALQRPNIVLGFVRPRWWWIGLILRKPDLETITQAEELANDLQRGIASAVPAVKGGKPSVLIEDGMITVGFFPPREIELIQE